MTVTSLLRSLSLSLCFSFSLLSHIQRNDAYLRRNKYRFKESPVGRWGVLVHRTQTAQSGVSSEAEVFAISISQVRDTYQLYGEINENVRF